MNSLSPKKIGLISAALAVVLITALVVPFVAVGTASAEVQYAETFSDFSYFDVDGGSFIVWDESDTSDARTQRRNSIFDFYANNDTATPLNFSAPQAGNINVVTPAFYGGEKRYAATLFFRFGAVDLEKFRFILDFNYGGKSYKGYAIYQVVYNNNNVIAPGHLGNGFYLCGVDPYTYNGTGRYKRYFLWDIVTGQAFPVTPDYGNRIVNNQRTAVTFLCRNRMDNHPIFIWAPEYTLTENVPMVWCAKIYGQNANDGMIACNLSVMDYLATLEISSNQYDQGYDHGYKEGKGLGYNSGYDAGYRVGFNDGNAPNNQMANVIPSTLGAVGDFFKTVLSVNVFGISLFSIVGTVGAILLLLWLVKIVKGG